MTSLKDTLMDIASSLARGKGNVGITTAPGGGFALVCGAPAMVKVPGGNIITLGMDQVRLMALRDECTRLLDESVL